jgi:hypothetical protein
MKTMEKHYVDFETAKWLKQNGFKLTTGTAYFYRIYQPSNNVEENIEIIYDADNYSNSEYEKFYRPEQHQVVEWLLINHNIWISVQRDYDVGVCLGFEYIIDDEHGIVNSDTYDTPQEAYSAAFDYIRIRLLIN